MQKPRSKKRQESFLLIYLISARYDLRRQKINELIQDHRGRTKLKLEKAPGIDDITPEIIKYIEEEGITQLTELQNEVMKTAKVPKE